MRNKYPAHLTKKEKDVLKQNSYRARNKEKVNSYKRAHYAKNKNVVKHYKIKAAYNISFEQYEAMKVAQDFKCAICLKALEASQFCIDHCHTTGKVRGLLCQTCNRGIGLLKDSTTVLVNAIKYLDSAA
jgi:hypothetical protein